MKPSLPPSSQGARQLDLSIVVPCYNEAPHLAESTDRLLEVLSQTRYDYEVLFVDDCSTDDTRVIIRELCESRARCRYVFHEHNRGRGAAFKWKAATSEALTDPGFVRRE